jgi:hypothetical protein
MGPQGIQGSQGEDAPIFEFAGIRHNVANSAVLDAIPVPNPYKPVVITLIYDGTDNTPDPDDPTQLRFGKGEVEMWVYAPAPYSGRALSTYAALPGDKRGDWISLGAIKPVKGDDGAQGPQGPQGNTGAKGDKGDKGDQGVAGPVGAQGVIGPKGDKGDKGDTGPAGTSLSIQGVIPGGDWGTVAPTGVLGQMWIAGGDITGFPVKGQPAGKTLPTGHGFSWDGTEWDDLGPVRGPKGDQGAPGPQGAQGPTGPQGKQGIKGDTGATGPQGPKGATGSQGPIGPAGPTLVGMIVAWGGGTAPAGWLECNGQSTAAYPQLGKVVGASVPDLRGEFIRGWDHGRQVDPGRSIRSFQDEDTNLSNINIDVQIGVRDTNFTCDNQGAPCTATDLRGVSYWKTGHLRLNSATGGDETRPRNIALMYIIKHD